MHLELKMIVLLDTAFIMLLKSMSRVIEFFTVWTSYLLFLILDNFPICHASLVVLGICFPNDPRAVTLSYLTGKKHIYKYKDHSASLLSIKSWIFSNLLRFYLIICASMLCSLLLTIPWEILLLGTNLCHLFPG